MNSEQRPASAAATAEIEPHLLVLFGATGDLAKRKLIPALYSLMKRRNFDDTTRILGVAGSSLSDEEYREVARQALIDGGVAEEEAAGWCAEVISYMPIREGFAALAERIDEIEAAAELPRNRAFYLAIPPSAFDDTIGGLASVGLHESDGWTRVVVEKPFGTDVDSAVELNEILHRSFDESQIYRIDHYLAKETVQNLLVFRFANPLFESAWNRDRIDSVEITFAETLGLEGRAGYFDSAGIVRDVVQNHLFQIMTLIAMEPPVRLNAGAIRDEKVKVLKSIYPVAVDDVVRAQYGPGSAPGEEVPGYLQEDGISSDSKTETYAAMRICVDNWRWRGVPFYLRAGKRLPERLTQIVVRFKRPPVYLFEGQGAPRLHANVMYITLQPDEGFDLRFDVKIPGEGLELVPQSLSFRYGDVFGDLPDAYETLIVDFLVGDQTLFVRADEAEEAWRILESVIDLDSEPDSYPAGSWGPPAADSLITGEGDHWHPMRGV
jgi:glucose-6-phosphate 1-dehydrogenase